ncbi:MAG: helix-turn-helix domain-containing protein [Deltaproteobacteria bacterium]|nr:helix-turn-helix domain-containing protein [Deltaproteobacteria bacterium]
MPMTRDEIRRQELSSFLRTRRARLSAGEVGLPAAARRRTPGLRREEVAQLAGMSVTWYTWLEQARPISASAEMVDNLARVLRLDGIERIQLFQLALRDPVFNSKPKAQRITPLLKQMLDQMEHLPAFILGLRWDVLAWNLAAGAFFGFPRIAAAERNFLWLVFTDSALRSLIIDWPTRARDVLARFRVNYGRHAGDNNFVQLVERLKSVSTEFAEWWPRHDVLPVSEGLKPYNHPVVGRLQLQHVSFSVMDDPDLTLTIMAPARTTDSVAKLRRIVSHFKSSHAASDRRTRIAI